MKIKFLGTGTYHGTPVPWCKCDVCKGVRRLRSSVLVSTNEAKILIDCSPDFRTQLLKYKIELPLNAIFITHAHEDHFLGLNELAYTNKFEILCYYHETFLKNLTFKGTLSLIESFGAKPVKFEEGREIKIEDMAIKPIRVLHTEFSETPVGETYGFSIISRGKSVFYAPDIGRLTQELIEILKEHDIKIIDGTAKKKEYKTHLSMLESVKILKDFKKVYFTHISHVNDITQNDLPQGFFIVNDGDEINL